jgi:lysophospholipase L1-like esterase
MSQPLIPRYNLGYITLVVICILSLSLNAKHVINKFIYRPPAIKPIFDPKKDLFMQIRQQEFDLLPIDSNSIVFVGNSLTQNFNVTEFFKNEDVKNRGIGGDVTQGVLDRLDEIVQGKPKKIFLEIGINDILDGISIDTASNNIDKIITEIQKGSPKTVIYIQSVLPCNYNYRDPSDKNMLASIINLNKVIENICVNRNIKYINLYSHFLNNDGLDVRYDSGDYLHLNGQGYIKWKELIEQYVN